MGWALPSWERLITRRRGQAGTAGPAAARPAAAGDSGRPAGTGWPPAAEQDTKSIGTGIETEETLLFMQLQRGM